MQNFVGILLMIHRRRLQLRAAARIFGRALAGVALSIVLQGSKKSSLYPYKRECSVRSQTIAETQGWQRETEWFMHEHKNRCPGALHELIPGKHAEYLYDAWGRLYELTCQDGGAVVHVCSRADDEHDPSDDICSEPWSPLF